MSKPVKISEKLLPYLDKAVDNIRDGFGDKKYPSRKAFVDAAVKEFLKEQGYAQEVPASG